MIERTKKPRLFCPFVFLPSPSNETGFA
ncbi:acetate/propionate kinase [Bacillus sp. NRRL B-14911]|nr:acetate/propionate kinase [Bacillus sp. NRRL B-14911]